MANKQKKMTFAVTPEMAPLLEEIKKEMFYNCTQSEMIRTLVEEGWDTIKNSERHIAAKQLT